MIYLVVEERESGYSPPEIMSIHTSKAEAERERERRVIEDPGDRVGLMAWDTETQRCETEWRWPGQTFVMELAEQPAPEINIERMGSMKVRKKPIEVAAWPVRELVEQSVMEWDALPQPIQDAYNAGKLFFMAGKIDVETEGTWHRAEPDDYIIYGIDGELYQVSPEIFEKTYEVVE